MDEQQLNQIEQLYNKIPKQVIANFVTKLSEYDVNYGEIDIPTEMDEAECNKLLKNLLQNNLNPTTLQSLNFEFLVGGRLLRGQIKSHIIRYEISCEETLQIEYFLAFENLQNEDTIKQDDWVSTLTSISNPLGNCYAVGLFSGSVTFYSQSNKQLLKSIIDDDVIKSLKVLAATTENSYYVIAGGINEEIKVGNLTITEGNTKASYEQLSAQQHIGSVLAIDTNPLDDGHFCVAGGNGNLSIYQIPENFLSSDQAFNQIKQKKKKRQLNQKSINFIASEKIHNNAINTVNWISQDRIVTGSSDHTMHLVDVEKLKSVGNVLTKDSITTCIDYSVDRLLTSHQDGYIRLWDIRAPQTPSHTFKGHSKLVNSVQFNSRPYIFASCSYDTTIKIWDYRSSYPIQNIGTHHDKVFSVLWKQQKQLIGGGSDSMVSVHSV